MKVNVQIRLYFSILSHAKYTREKRIQLIERNKERKVSTYDKYRFKNIASLKVVPFMHGSIHF